jgi:hypothetical protein
MREVHTSHARIEGKTENQVCNVAELHPDGSLPEELGMCVSGTDVEGEGGKKGQASGVAMICMDGTPEKLGGRPCMKKVRLIRG